jgi:hypothetical protein
VAGTLRVPSAYRTRPQFADALCLGINDEQTVSRHLRIQMPHFRAAILAAHTDLRQHQSFVKLTEFHKDLFRGRSCLKEPGSQLEISLVKLCLIQNSTFFSESLPGGKSVVADIHGLFIFCQQFQSPDSLVDFTRLFCSRQLLTY